LSPTRELATQITDVINKYGKELRVKAVCIFGGMPYREQLRKLSQPSDIIIATPGRLIDYMRRGSLDLSRIKMLILDEADRMLDMGFIEDVSYIAAATSKERQTLLFTATMNKKLIELASNILQSPQHIEVAHKTVTLDNITQRIHVADDIEHKSRLLQHLLTEENIYKAIIFLSTKRHADKLAKQLREEGHLVDALHGDISQRNRNKIITHFRTGKITLLVATDVAARGIDIQDISHVINYDLPKFAEDYVHRIGRTGRAGKSGIAVSFVLSSEGNLLKRIERFTAQPLPRDTIEGLEPRQTLSVDRPAKTRRPKKYGASNKHNLPRSKPRSKSRFNSNKSFNKS
jgi:superfamily II DNA/RNA helicase